MTTVRENFIVNERIAMKYFNARHFWLDSVVWIDLQDVPIMHNTRFIIIQQSRFN